MRTVEVRIFQFEELSDDAKEKARDWYRERIEFDAEDMFESFETAAKILGVEFACAETSRSRRNGSTVYKPDIRYSGFSSQGDGLSFVGTYTAKGCSKAIRAEFGTDKKLHRIADELTALYGRYRLLYGGKEFSANITQSSSHYVHKNTMDVEVISRDDDGEVEFSEDDELLDLMRDFAQWMYDSLETEYEYQNSDEAVDETIIANEYEFTEEGERA